MTQIEKGRLFAALHERDGAFIIPNPWDVGTARLLAQLGFEALATTSAGYSFSRGQRDNSISRDEMMMHVATMASATDLPVSADLENGFGDSPEMVAETIKLAVGAGLVGGSIEDMSRQPGRPIYEIGFATERVRAAAEVARALGRPPLLGHGLLDRNKLQQLLNHGHSLALGSRPTRDAADPDRSAAIA